MDNSFTRISDLPNGNAPGGKPHEMPNNYIPINVHPNPYGISDKNPIIDLPQDTTVPIQQHNIPQMRPPVPQQLSETDIAQLNAMQQQRLPSRDIQHDTTSYSHDEHVQPNYIPRQKDLDDYVRDHEKTTEKNHI